MTEYVRVPREPTPEMLKAGASTLDDFWKAQERGPTHVQEAWPGIVQIYAAMLAASPQGEGSLADAQGWRDIATAPRDGDDILVCCGPDSDPMFGVASWHDDSDGGGWQMWWSGTEKHTWPEFWMPLPPAPSAHPAPIKPSGDTGELREKMKRAIWTQLPQEDANMGTSGRIADAILDLIQSERAG